MSKAKTTIECAICGESLTKYNIGMHVKKYHGEDPEEYKIKHGIKKSKAQEEAEKVERKITRFVDVFFDKDFLPVKPEATESNKEKLHHILHHYYKTLNVTSIKVHHNRAFARVLFHFPEFTKEQCAERVIDIINYDGPKGENEEYLMLLGGEEYTRETLQIKSDRVSGENNPGFDHGGKLSPFSMDFIEYEGLSDVEKEKAIQDKIDLSIESRGDNYTTKIEYYINQGMSESEARDALFERQRVGALDKFIDRYGDVEGQRKWEERQRKWMATLDAKSDEEKNAINSKKRPINSILHKRYDDPNQQAILYLLKFTNKETGEEFHKVGVTTKTIKKRFSRDLRYFAIEELHTSTPSKIEDVCKLENHLLSKYKELSYKPKQKFEGWTECFQFDPQILQEVTESMVCQSPIT